MLAPDEAVGGTVGEGSRNCLDIAFVCDDELDTTRGASGGSSSRVKRGHWRLVCES